MRPRSSRRATKLGLAALVSFSLIAAACGSSDGDSSDSGGGSTDSSNSGSDDSVAPTDTEAPVVSEGQIDEETVDPVGDPVAGGTLRYGVRSDPDGLNPTSSALDPAGLMMSHAVFDTVAAYDTDDEPVPFLAESIEAVDGDLTKWQVKVREGVTFHDGTPLDAAALQVNFEAAKADGLVGLAVRPFHPEEGATEIIDELTLQYNLLEPSATFPAKLASQVGLVASPAWLAAAAEDPTLNQQPVGTGPFKFESRSADSVTRFVRNDDWWGGEVYLDAVEFVVVTDTETRTDLLFSGDLQAMHTLSPTSVDELTNADGIQNIVDETGEENFLMLNSEVAPFNDLRARQALTFATPLENYRALIGLGLARPADQMFIPESIYYNPDVTQEGDMPELVAALVADYCAERGAEENPILGTTACTDGKINMEYQIAAPSVVNDRTADLFDQGWKEFFNVTFDRPPNDQSISDSITGQYNVVSWNQLGEVEPSIDRVYLICSSIGAISLNFPRYCSEARDASINEALASTEREDRVPAWQSVVQDMHDSYTYVFLDHIKWDNAFAENVHGMCDRTSPEGTPLRCTTRGGTWVSSVWLSE